MGAARRSAGRRAAEAMSAGGGGSGGGGGGGPPNDFEAQMQMAMMLSMQQPTAAVAGGGGGAASQPTLSAAAVTQALSQMTSPSTAASSGSGGLTPAAAMSALPGLLSALPGAAAASPMAVDGTTSSGAVRPRATARPLDDSARAAAAAIFGCPSSIPADDVDELERHIQRQLASKGLETIAYLSECYERAAAAAEPKHSELSLEICRNLTRGYLLEGAPKDQAETVLGRLLSAPPTFVEAVLSSEAGEAALEPLLRAASEVQRRADISDAAKLIDVRAQQMALVSSTATSRALTLSMQREAAQARRYDVMRFEKTTVCGMLSISPLSLLRPQQTASEYVALEQMSRTAEENPAVMASQEAMQGVWKMQKEVLTKLVKSKAAGPGVTKEAVVDWLAVLFDLNTRVRGAPSARKKPKRSQNMAASHGLMINCTSVLLDWCLPFCADKCPKAARMHGNFARLSPDWCSITKGGPQRVHYEIEATFADPEQGKAEWAASSGGGGGGGAHAALNSSSGSTGFGYDRDDEEADMAAAIEESILQVRFSVMTRACPYLCPPVHSSCVWLY